MNSWAIEAARSIISHRIGHKSYERCVLALYTTLCIAQPGEVLLLVGPSRVGKSKVIQEAGRQLLGSIEPNERAHTFVYLEAQNAGISSFFSSKTFTADLLSAVQHPIYGVPAPDDPFGHKLDTRLNRTPETTLRTAFERACDARAIRYLALDEFHHVAHAKGGPRAQAAILDSWKCLAAKKGLVLILIGPYNLLQTVALSSHLIGRTRLVEFPRYRAEHEHDRRAFAEVLKAWSPLVRFDGSNVSLLTWASTLFGHSLGCVGRLALRLTEALSVVAANGAPHLTLQDILCARPPGLFDSEVRRDIEMGERLIEATQQCADGKAPASIDLAGVPTQRKGKPFQRKSQRFDLGGRT